ncbi:MAG: hypothetical protein KIG16_02125 [Eubacteriales bacterium]|nr:hypothetical protein [Eubacteriales bacterium]
MSAESSALKTMAKLAYQRLSSGFWQEEKLRRKNTLTILKNQGADTTAAKKYLVDHTKQQLAAVTNPVEEAQYARVKVIFDAGDGENALASLMDKELMKTMDEGARQRYIFGLSSKLQEYRDRYEKERQFNCQTMSLSL